MKKFLLILPLALILFVVQPASVLKADLASDMLEKALKKTQELAEKQKIKGKKLNEFILNNVITVDYDGKKQSYKFNKNITYEVYEGKKVVGEGTWAIKGLTKSSIKLSGYRDLYFQIYKAKDRISTITNLKKKNNNQTNRKILKIVSPNDFEKQLAQVELKEEKKKVTDKQETKKEEKVTEEKKQVAVETKKEERKKTEDVSVGKDLEYKTVDLRNDFEFYTKDFIEDKIIGNYIAFLPCKGAGSGLSLVERKELYQCGHLDPSISSSYQYVNFAVRKPFNLHWYMLNYGGKEADETHSSTPAIITLGKNWALYKDPRWKVKHNQKVCDPNWDTGSQLKKEDCVDGVSVLTFDVSFIKGRGVLGQYDLPSVGTIIKPSFNTGLGGTTGELFPSSDTQDKHWRKKLSFVFKKNNRFYKEVNSDSLFGNPYEKSIAFMYAVAKVGDPILKSLPEFEDHYISYNSIPWASLMVSVGLDERIGEEKQHHIDTKLASIVFDVVENGKRTIPGTDAQDIAKKWEELSILGEDLKKCLNDNKTDFDKLESCSKSYQKSTRKIIDWKEEGWHNPSNKASIFNVAIVKLFPPEGDYPESELIHIVQRNSSYEIEPIREGIISFWEITGCIDEEIKKVEYEPDLDIISILEQQNCFQLLDKNIAFNKEISQKLKEVKVIKKTKKEKAWIGIKYEEVSEKLAEEVGLIKKIKKEKDMSSPGKTRILRDIKQMEDLLEKLDQQVEAGKGESGTAGVRTAGEEHTYQQLKGQLKAKRDHYERLPKVFEEVIVTDCPDTLSCGLIVKRVFKDSPADKVGIKVDDIILRYNGKSMYDSTGLVASLVFKKLVDDTIAGQEVSLKIWRNKKELTKKITLGILKESLDWNTR